MFVVSKKKNIDEVINLFENNDKVSEIHIVSRPHMRLLQEREAHRKIKELGSKKLQELQSLEPIEAFGHGNVEYTLDHILDYDGSLQNENELLLICGSFFIMSDVRQYFGYDEVIENIK